MRTFVPRFKVGSWRTVRQKVEKGGGRGCSHDGQPTHPRTPASDVPRGREHAPSYSLPPFAAQTAPRARKREVRPAGSRLHEDEAKRSPNHESRVLHILPKRRYDKH